MNKIHNTFYLILIGISFAGSPPDAGGGGWLDKWLTIDSGLLLWTIVTFLVLLFILRWKAWGPLMNALDTMNARFGRDTISFAAKGFKQGFAMRRNYLSKRYTTRIHEIPRIKC